VHLGQRGGRLRLGGEPAEHPPNGLTVLGFDDRPDLGHADRWNLILEDLLPAPLRRALDKIAPQYTPQDDIPEKEVQDHAGKVANHPPVPGAVDGQIWGLVLRVVTRTLLPPQIRARGSARRAGSSLIQDIGNCRLGHASSSHSANQLLAIGPIPKAAPVCRGTSRAGFSSLIASFDMAAIR